MKRIVRGNDFFLRIPVRKVVGGEQFAFPLAACETVSVSLVNSYRRYALEHSIWDGDDLGATLSARVEGDSLPCGCYALEVRGRLFGSDWRSNEYEQICLVENNASADTEFSTTDEGENSVEMDTAIVLMGASDPAINPMGEWSASTAYKRGDAVSHNLCCWWAYGDNTASEPRQGSSDWVVLLDTTPLRDELEQSAAAADAAADRANTAADNANAAAAQALATDKAVNEAEAERASAELARAEAEDSRTSAETARQSAETARQSAETARASAETARVKAEAARVDAETAREAASLAAVSNAEQATTDAQTAAEAANAATANTNAAITAANEAAANTNAAITAANEATAKVSTATKNAETATANANAATTAANTATANAKTATTDAQTAATAANNAATKAENAASKADTAAAKATTAATNADTATANTNAAITAANEATAKANTATKNADTATDAAKAATADAQTATEAAKTATTDAQTATANAKTATTDAQTATANAKTATTDAQTATAAANTATKNADAATTKANTATTAADKATTAANTAATTATTAASNANTATTAANNAATAAQTATTAANNATTAANTAAAKAENVNATLDGNTFRVTDRNGTTKELDIEALVTSEEQVTVQIVSNVASVSASGVTLSVYINHGSAATKYTTGSDGKATFSVPMGSYYEINFPDFATARPISPVGYTATIPTRTITATYDAYEEEEEQCYVEVKKHVGTTASAFEGVQVAIKIGDGAATTYTTDSNGQVAFTAMAGKTVTVTLEDLKGSGWYAHNGKLTRTFHVYAGGHTEHAVYYQFRNGVFVVSADGSEYLLDEWTAAGKTSSDAVLLKVVTENLFTNDAVVMLDPLQLSTRDFPNKQWCTQQVQFPSFANGQTYKGQEHTQLMLEDAEELGYASPAAEYATSLTKTVGGQTLTGYIGAANQWVELWANRAAVDDILTALYGSSTKLLSDYTANKWTSDQRNATHACIFASQVNNYGDKTGTFAVVPFYAY